MKKTYKNVDIKIINFNYSADLLTVSNELPLIPFDKLYED